MHRRAASPSLSPIHRAAFTPELLQLPLPVLHLSFPSCTPLVLLQRLLDLLVWLAEIRIPADWFVSSHAYKASSWTHYGRRSSLLSGTVLFCYLGLARSFGLIRTFLW